MAAHLQQLNAEKQPPWCCLSNWTWQTLCPGPRSQQPSRLPGYRFADSPRVLGSRWYKSTLTPAKAEHKISKSQASAFRLLQGRRKKSEAQRDKLLSSCYRATLKIHRGVFCEALNQATVQIYFHAQDNVSRRHPWIHRFQSGQFMALTPSVANFTPDIRISITPNSFQELFYSPLVICITWAVSTILNSRERSFELVNISKYSPSGLNNHGQKKKKKSHLKSINFKSTYLTVIEMQISAIHLV